ncbi:glycosyltransferase [Marinobacter nauticus]|uniref:glycosyltransferase n=1 Tax=Marinobacter nauticus TaxID=2743 RepID=UPI001CD5BDE5|nr:glycosyltransferase [Marinobacter nauticus]MCA0912763.1 glycosyltransferase [Marinobacter nauticus]
MDALISKAIELAQQPQTPITPIPGRIAYVVSHGQSYASNGYAIRTQGVARALNQHGLETLCFVRPGRPWELGSQGAVNASVQPETQVEGVRYIHSRWPGDKTPAGEGDHLEQSVARYMELFRVYRPAAVLAASNCIVGLPAWVAAKRLGLPFYNEVRGFWELSRDAREPGYASQPLFKAEAERDTFVARQANSVFTLNQPMKDELAKRDVDPARIFVIPNGVSTLPNTKTVNPALKKKLGINNNETVVGYIGSFSPYEGLDVLLEACTELVQKGEKLKLLLVGDNQPVSEPVASGLGRDKDTVTKDPAWVLRTGRVPHDKLRDYYTLLDAVVIPRKKLPVCELVPPMKAAEALAYGKRLVVSDVTPLADYAEKFYGVVSFEAGSAKSLATALQRSLKLAVPKPSTELLFSAHIEPMVKALKGEGSAAVQKATPDPLTTTEPLIELARRLAKTRHAALIPTEGRVAVVASHSFRANQPGYAKRVQQLAKRFQACNWEALCMVSPFGADNKAQSGEPKVLEDGVTYLQGQWPLQAVPTCAEVGFTTSVEIFSQWFKTHRPQVVVAASDFTSALPAIVAARQLSLPVIKEQLHFADVFEGAQSHGFFERIDFAQKFAAEQACLELANASYYLYPDDEASWDTLQQVVDQVCHKAPSEKPLATLKPKARYTVRQPVEGGGLYYLELGAEDAASGNPKGIVASFRFLGRGGKPLPQKLPGFSSSKAYPQYQYIDTSAANGRHRAMLFQLPAGVSQVEVDIVAFVTQDKLTLHHARVGKVSLVEAARWLSFKVPGVHWIKAVEAFVHKEGAASLRLALLDYKYRLSKHLNDQKQLSAAIQEMVELDRAWLPELAHSGKTLPIKANSRLTVAHLHKTAYPYENTGGAIRCLNTALSQQRIGIDPYIVTPIGYPRSAGVEGAKNHEVIEGIEHFRIGANTDGLRGISLADRTRYSAFHIAKLLKQRGASVIHAASGVRGYELALQALALKRLTGLPLLYEVRSFHEHTWTPVRNDVMDLERTQLRVIKENFCMAEADFVTTISHSMKKILIERGVAPEKIEVIPNAIDESKYLGKIFSPMPIPGLEGAEMVVGYISNMSRREGHQYLIRAIHQLRQGTGRDIRGLLVGNGPERESLEQLAAELGLQDVIAFPGEVDHSQINAYYKAIDLFVIPRIPDYAADWVTPLKPYEAMALERPIIVSDLPALKEIVGDHEERGLVAKPADVESLVTQLQRYIDDPDMRQRKVNNAREWVFAERTWSANAKRYEVIYRRLMENHAISEKEPLHA